MACTHLPGVTCTQCVGRDQWQEAVKDWRVVETYEGPLCDRCREPKCARCGGPLHPNYLRSGWCTNGGLNR